MSSVPSNVAPFATPVIDVEAPPPNMTTTKFQLNRLAFVPNGGTKKKAKRTPKKPAEDRVEKLVSDISEDSIDECKVLPHGNVVMQSENSVLVSAATEMDCSSPIAESNVLSLEMEVAIATKIITDDATPSTIDSDSSGSHQGTSVNSEADISSIEEGSTEQTSSDDATGDAPLESSTSANVNTVSGKRKRSPRKDLADMVTDVGDQEADMEDEMKVGETANESNVVKTKKPPATRKPRAKKAAKTANSNASSNDTSVNTEPSVPVALTKEQVYESLVDALTPEMKVKLNYYKERFQLLFSELETLEKEQDLFDGELNTTALLEDLKTALRKLHAVESDATNEMEIADITTSNEEVVVVNGDVAAVTPTVPVAEPQSNFVKVQHMVQSLIARLAQGSPDALTVLVDRVMPIMIALQDICQASNPPLTELTSPTEGVEALNTYVTSLCDKVILGEELKRVTSRESLGNRMKDSDLYADTEAHAVWRWELTLTSIFSPTPAEATILREMKMWRGKYSRCMKATGKLIEHITGVNASNKKASTEGFNKTMSQLEEKLAKTVVDLEKSKERRIEVIRKKQVDAAEKVRKSQIADMAKKEKEEIALKKAYEVKEKQLAVEKVKKEELEASTKKLEKQQNALKSFFVRPKQSMAAEAGSANAISVVDASSAVVRDNGEKAQVICVDEEESFVASLHRADSMGLQAVVATTTTTTGPKVSPAIASARERIRTANHMGVQGRQPFDLAEFEKHIGISSEAVDPMSMGDLSRYYKKRYSSQRTTVKKKRHLQKLTVTVHGISSGSGFDEFNNKTYSELREVKIDPFMKSLMFHEDYRPPYRGTFSKTSDLVGPRRPFAKDAELFNYEFDSEAEWDPEDEVQEGEDIEESDGEEEEEEDLELGTDGKRKRRHVCPHQNNPLAAANDIVYDDFFRRDGDYSDVESDCDSMGVVRKSDAKKNGREAVGIRFIAADPGAPSSSTLVNNTSPPQPFTACHFSMVDGALVPVDVPDASDVECLKLRAYATIVHDNKTFPILGEEIVSAVTSTKRRKGDGEPTPPKPTYEHVLPDLARHVHNNKEGIDKLINSFHEKHATIPKAQIRKMVLGMAKRTRGESQVVVTATAKEGEGDPAEVSGTGTGGKPVVVVVPHGTARWAVHMDSWKLHHTTERPEVVYTPVKAAKKRSKALSNGTSSPARTLVMTEDVPVLDVSTTTNTSSSSSSSSPVTTTAPCNILIPRKKVKTTPK